ncbi:RRP15 [Candida margitis]|uniref:RRP15 n=1 Tax=Candida margitis TaxID=1775924 RepID=UPI002227389F|nr:RRP15 [Candida margitis]KAI5957912.1 RRP15 [Candida margitis]
MAKEAKIKPILKNKRETTPVKYTSKSSNLTSQPSDSSGEKSEEESSLDEEKESDLDEDDEVDVADVSSGDDSDDVDSEEDPVEEEDDSFPLKKKQKKNRDDGSESFANAFNSIINSKLKAYNRKDPILARNKTTLKKLEGEKLENKAKRALLLEKKQFQDKHRVKQLLPVASEGSDSSNIREILDKEKQMKKVAQKGVVKLFNAVLSTQLKTNQEVTKVQAGQSRKEELMTDVSKEKFMDLIAAAGED